MKWSDKIRIGLLGAPINNGNLGCQALTYSLVSLLVSLESDLNREMEIHLFEYHPDQNKYTEFCNVLGIPKEKIVLHKLTSIGELKSYVKHGLNNIKVIKALRSLDCIIDMTEGDSFTDIYGQKRFLTLANQKRIIEMCGKTLILGPQTIGPFKTKKNSKFAGKVLKDAKVVITRDTTSMDLARMIGRKDVELSTDLAFLLPYNKSDKSSQVVKKIGLNISGLLIVNSSENTKKAFELKTNYDKYIDKLLFYLSSKENVEIYLIPHVKEDCEAISYFHKKYPNTMVIEMFRNPIEAKSFISTMDFFIGARMHATIAAFTSGVLTIPTAYSMKFSGLFGLVDYNVVIDLEHLTTNDAVKETIKLLESDELSQALKSSLIKAEKLKIKTRKLFLDIMKSI